MADEQKQPAKPEAERRTSKPGIKSGGRRKADRKLVTAGKKGRVLIALSFGISACIIGWAFSLPFRGNDSIVGFADSAKQGDQLDARTVSRSTKSEQNRYVDSMLELERDLKLQRAVKNQVRRNTPGKESAKRNWKNRLRTHIEDVRVLKEAAGGEIKKGTIEWQTQQDLRAFLEDVPE